MNYENPDLLNRLGSEYVLGTLAGPARRRFARLLRDSPAAQDAVRYWEARLDRLSGSVPEQPVPPRVWQAIEARIGAAGATPMMPWWKRWLSPAVSLAAGFVLALGLVQFMPRELSREALPTAQTGVLPESYVGLLTDQSGMPAVLAGSKRHGKALFVKILRPQRIPPGQVLELWALPAAGVPFPIGTIPARDKATIPLAEDSETLFKDVPRLGVTIESAPAAAGAAPSGPFVLSGHCVKLW
jgi:anti-sigma-K factor RskA